MKRIKNRPLRNTQALKIFRRVLIEGGLDPEVAAQQTLGGWRVCMPDLAWRAGLAKERRKYLGRWA